MFRCDDISQWMTQISLAAQTLQHDIHTVLKKQKVGYHCVDWTEMCKKGLHVTELNLFSHIQRDRSKDFKISKSSTELMPELRFGWLDHTRLYVILLHLFLNLTDHMIVVLLCIMKMPSRNLIDKRLEKKKSEVSIRSEQKKYIKKPRKNTKTSI